MSRRETVRGQRPNFSPFRRSGQFCRVLMSFGALCRRTNLEWFPGLPPFLYVPAALALYPAALGQWGGSHGAYPRQSCTLFPCVHACREILPPETQTLPHSRPPISHSPRPSLAAPSRPRSTSSAFEAVVSDAFHFEAT